METIKRVVRQYDGTLVKKVTVRKDSYVSFERKRRDTYLNEAENMEYRRYHVLKNNRSDLFENITN